jgi:ABC-type sugar transport system, ATPase component
MALLKAQGVVKTFPGVVALNNVNLSIRPGSIHCIIGENGAGKSTLVKVLTGVYVPDKGEVTIDGENALQHPHLFAKVAYVPQELSLFPEMTVAENLFMPFAKSGINGALVTGGRLYQAALPHLERFHIEVSPRALVKNISISEQQLLQIARALTNRSAEVLILDEPTTSLTEQETERLFRIVRRLKDEKHSVVFISHKLEEIYALGDEITVMRNGEQVANAPIAEITQRQLIVHMSGRDFDLDETFRPELPTGKPLLEVKNLSGVGFDEIDFTLYEGEVLGFAGLIGAGRSEIMQTIFGFLPEKSGQVTLSGRPWKFRDTNASMKNGLVYLPEERKHHGILPLLSVRQNIGISVLGETTKGFLISRAKEAEIARQIINLYEVKTSSDEKRIVFLSGGNQQKIIIGRNMRGRPKVLIFDEPTKGIDVKTKADIYRIMKELAEKERVGIILVSSEMKELLRCSNRVVAIYHGRKTGEFDPITTSAPEIVGAIIGAEGVDHG